MKKIILFIGVLLLTAGMHAQCVEYQDGPYVSFNQQGGAPPPNGEPIEITDFEVWKSEAYALRDVIEGETYIFSACNGPGAGSWPIDFTVGPNNGVNDLAAVDAFGLDPGSTCAITFTASTSGNYLLIVSEKGNCNVAAEINNGFPKIEWTETLSTPENQIEGFNYFFNAQSQNLVIKANKAFSSIRIFNVKGQEVINKNLSSTHEVVNLATLKAGVYIGIAIANGEIATFKLVKK